ncbi:MAG: hypothetical protein J6K20_14890 [Thermoguttaceae bacterium]|nr:hypothetical protein [Thermoguttaceae bacterium]
MQKLLNPFPQIYDKHFSADVGTLLHDGATIPPLDERKPSRRRVDGRVGGVFRFLRRFSRRVVCFRGAISSRGKNAKRRFADASRNDEIPTIFHAFSLNSP